MEKIVFIEGSSTPSLASIKDDLADGWSVKMIAPQNVSSSGSFSRYGGFMIVLELVSDLKGIE